MKLNFNVLPLASMLLSLSLITASCADDISDDDHYKPHQSAGNAYQVLQSEGNYNMFLHAIDLSGYKQIVDGKSIMTVMAPNDDAFAEFLAKKGYASVDEMQEKDAAYLKKLVGFHLMYYSFDWDKLVNFRPAEGDGATDEQKQVDAGLFYKHRTHSSDPIEQMRVKMTANATTDTLLHIYHYDRYLPVFSNKFFATKGIDAAYNYEYFYPNSKWNTESHSADGYFNVSNAQVSDEGNVLTDNGYLYHVNQVLEPLNTIYDQLKNNEKYSEFLKLYDGYSTYSPADDYTNQNLGYIAYVHEHGSLPKIACEWPVTNFKLMTQLERAGYNLFVPSNEAITDFFKNYWSEGCGYKSIADLDSKILSYFIMQSFSKNNLVVFPEELKRGEVETYLGTPINIDPDKVTDRVMCENGAFYGMDKMDAPAIFSSVVGPAFKDSTYLYYLYALDGSNLVLSLASNKSSFVTLMPTNKQVRNSDPAMRLYATTSGNELQQYSSDAGDFVAVGQSTMLNMVNIHTAPNISSLPQDGAHVVKTNMAFNYWFVKDGKITTNALFNEQLNPSFTGTPFSAFREITNNGKAWDNGKSYAYDAAAPFEAVNGDGLAHALAVAKDKNYSYYLFAQLLQKAGLTEEGTLTPSVYPGMGYRFFVFVPTNEAIKNHIKDIPGCSALSVADNGTISGNVLGTNKTKLAAYLRGYFVTSLMNAFSDYPYIGSSCKGTFRTSAGLKMNVVDNKTSLSVQLEGGKAVGVNAHYGYLPFAFSDGCMHFIDGIL